MLVPHKAQESLSSDHTPTLLYSLPFYHSIIDEWEYLKGVYPLLSPFIDVGINKVKAYINKSKLSQIYLLAICNSLFLCRICLHTYTITSSAESMPVSSPIFLQSFSFLFHYLLLPSTQPPNTLFAFHTLMSHNKIMKNNGIGTTGLAIRGGL